jgi:hypothetical protein
MWRSEDMSIEEKIESTINLRKQMEVNFVSLGQLLSEMKRFKINVSRGYKKFSEFVENEFNISSSFANKLISIYALFIENLEKDESTLLSIGFDKLNMIKPFVKESNILEIDTWIELAQDMTISDLRDKIKEIRDAKKKARRTLKDVFTEQYIEKMVTFFNCSRKELDFKLALYFQCADMEQLRQVVRERQLDFEREQLKSQENNDENTEQLDRKEAEQA